MIYREHFGLYVHSLFLCHIDMQYFMIRNVYIDFMVSVPFITFYDEFLA